MRKMRILQVLLVSVIVMTSSNNVEGYRLVCDAAVAFVNQFFCAHNHPQAADCHTDSLKFHFYLHNENSKKEQKICPPNICSYKFDPEQRTTIIIHGYLASRNAFWVKPMIEALRRQNNRMNVITVEWFKHINYNTAAKAVVDVADRVARMVRELLFNNTVLKKEKIHIIGHSLGAHIAGLTASMLKNTYWPVDRVTGLDPAKPLFESENNSSVRLNKTVAKFVDVIHTNSDYENSGTFGFFKPMGHIDFYPNGGDNQPNCRNNRESRTFEEEGCFSNRDVSVLKMVELAFNLKLQLLNGQYMICDHEIAAVYFTESLNRTFFATKKQSLAHISNARSNCGDRGRDQRSCINDASCAEMGIHAEDYEDTRQGNYYVKTDCDAESTQSSEFLDYLLWL